MDESRDREVFKPPRPPTGNLQALPTYPWMFSWPMRANVRLHLTNAAYYRNYTYHCCPESVISYPYRKNWQFRDHEADSRINHEFIDLRGGPANIRNVTGYSPQPTPFPRLHGDRDLVAENDEGIEHVRLQRLEARIWDEWMRQYGAKYFYLQPGEEL